MIPHVLAGSTRKDVGMHRSRTLLTTGLAALAAALASAPAASAASAGLFNGTLTVTGTGDPEAITITQGGGIITVTAPTFVADPDDVNNACEKPSATTITCTDAAVTTLAVKAGAGVDTVLDARTTAQGGDNDVIEGEGGNDVLSFGGDQGTAHDVTLKGGADDDTLTKNALAVALDGGPGADTLNAGTRGLNFNDTGGEGNDVFNGAAQLADIVRGEAGADTYTLGNRVPEPDETVDDPGTYQLGNSADLVSYDDRDVAMDFSLDGAANDGVAGENDNVQADIEYVLGGSGVDTMTAGASAVVFQGNGGDDVLTGGPGDDRLGGESGTDTLTGNGGDDQLTDGDFTSTDINNPGPAAGNDKLDGGPGNDSFSVDRGADDIIGGSGQDSLSYYRVIPQDPVLTTPVAVAGFEISLDDVANDGARGAAEGDNVHADIENVGTADGDDVLTGAAGAERFDSRGGNDTITPGAGVDIVDAGAGNDTISAVDGATDRLVCAAGADTVTADLAGGQPDRADVLIDCETIGGTPFPATVPGDTAGPAVTLTGGDLKAGEFRKSLRLRVSVGCDEACSVAGQVFTSSARIAKVGQLQVAGGRLASGTGKRTLTLRVAKKFRKAFKRKLNTKKKRRKGLKLSVSVTARDAAGNTTTKTKTIAVKG